MTKQVSLALNFVGFSVTVATAPNLIMVIMWNADRGGGGGGKEEEEGRRRRRNVIIGVSVTNSSAIFRFPKCHFVNADGNVSWNVTLSHGWPSSSWAWVKEKLGNLFMTCTTPPRCIRGDNLQTSISPSNCPLQETQINTKRDIEGEIIIFCFRIITPPSLHPLSVTWRTDPEQPSW